MSSPEARGLTEEWIAEHGDPDLDHDPVVDEDHLRQQIQDDRFYYELDWDAAIRENADREQAERDDPNTARMVEARDLAAAAGRFDQADAEQRVIEAVRRDHASFAAHESAQQAQGPEAHLARSSEVLGSLPATTRGAHAVPAAPIPAQSPSQHPQLRR